MHAMVVTFVVWLLFFLCAHVSNINQNSLFFYSVESHLRKMAGSTLPCQLKAKVLCFTRSEK